MQYTRRQIIEHLRKYKEATVPSLSQSLNLTLSNIRHHIKKLEKQGIIEEIRKQPADGRGRPTKWYGISEGALDHNLDELSSALLKVLLKNVSPTELTNRYLAIAVEMAGDFKRYSNSVQRLNYTINWLNNRHYQARWEASPTGPRVIIEHCPYSTIQGNHPGICQVDARMLTLLTGVQLHQIVKRQSNSPGQHHCIFSGETLS